MERIHFYGIGGGERERKIDGRGLSSPYQRQQMCGEPLFKSP